MEETILTTPDVAKMLRIAPVTAWRLREELGGFQVGINWRFRLSDIESYIQGQREKVQEQRRRRKAPIKSEEFNDAVNSELDLLSSYHL